jgi:hypothetical protein
VNEIVLKDGLELGLVGASNFPVQITSVVGGSDFAAGEKFLLLGDGGQHGVVGSAFINVVRGIYI